jgi:hypothetical protein
MNPKIVFKKMTSGEIDQIAEISSVSFDKYNIPMSKLGVKYLKKVYFPCMLQCEGAEVIMAMEGKKVLGYYAYQKNFREFSKLLSKKNFLKTSFYMMLAFLKFKLYPKDILNLLKIMGWIEKQSKGMETQVGPIATAPEIKGTTQGGMISFMLIREVLRILKSEGVKYAWSTVDERNRSRHISKSFGFEIVASKKVFGTTEHFLVKKM